MKSNKKKLWLFLLMLAFCFAFTTKTAQAASYRQIAYVNSTDKALILKFRNFCSSGYTWKVTKGNSSSACLSGSVTGASSGDKFIKIALGSKYSTKTMYKLTVTGKNKSSITVNYYTGVALTKATVSKTSKDALKVSSTWKNGYACTGEFLVFHGADSTNLLASAKLTKSSVGSSTTSLTASIAGSRLANAEYKTYTILSYRFNGKLYYGQGSASTYDFIKTQATVTGLRASLSGCKVKLAWTSSKNASYYKVYQSTKKSSGYKCIASKVKTSSYTTSSLTGGKTYYFKVQAYGAAGTKTVAGGKSAVKSAKVPVVPATVSNVRLGLNMSEDLVLKWNKSVNTTGYKIYYKAASSLTYKLLGTTTKRTYNLGDLKNTTKYNIKVLAYRKVNGKVSNAAAYSKVLTFTPKSYKSSHRTELLANGVRTIEHKSDGSSVYTSSKYSKERKEAFVNYKGYSSSTGYLIWISHYTQQVNIFKGSKGHWKLYKSCLAATGRAVSPSPQGVYKVTYKETGWYYTYTKELYVTHWCGRNSFHTRPLWNDGSVATSTIGRPASHGCARLYNSDARWIYNNIGRGTTVVSY